MFLPVDNMTSRPAAAPGPLLRRSRSTRAFTLVEVLIASLVMAIVLGGILATIIQSRRLTEGSIVQNSVITIMQGYIEQTKSMDYADLVESPAALYSSADKDKYALPTLPAPLYVSAGSPPSKPTTTLPALAYDNAPQNLAIKNPAVNPNDTLDLHVWIWVKDLSKSENNTNAAAIGSSGAKQVTIFYTYTFMDGGRVRSFCGSLRTMRSVVPSF